MIGCVSSNVILQPSHEEARIKRLAASANRKPGQASRVEVYSTATQSRL